ncbi:hypothetical protein K440DRAFT_640554 [Wilcoxina mikolae CBS 423.85]|nr:hypothetical protein K440DRAFT_640554 [Wilcoxina mikolae CBS 423.85]
MRRSGMSRLPQTSDGVATVISTQPFNIAPKRSRQAPIVAHSTPNQREIIGSKLKRWCHKRWRAVVATHDEERFFAILADEWLMSSIQYQRVAHFVNEIKDRRSLYVCVGKTIDCSALEQFADEIVEFAILESSRRPPTPPHESTTAEDVVPATPSIRWLLQNQLTPATTPGTGRRRHQVLTQGRNRDASVKLKEIRGELAELEERIRSTTGSTRPSKRGRFPHISPHTRSQVEKEYRSLKSKEYYWTNKCCVPRSGLAELVGMARTCTPTILEHEIESRSGSIGD